MMRRMRRLEWFLLLFQTILVMLVVGGWDRLLDPRGQLIGLLASMGMLLLCRTVTPKNHWLRGFCEWGYLYPFIFFSYVATGKLIPLYWSIGLSHDECLAAVDGRLFGVSPALWKTGIGNPVLVELCAYGYVSYFFFGVLLVGSIYRKHDAGTAIFAALFSSVVVAFYLSYIGYWIFPAMGPRYLWKEFLDPLRGYAIANHAFHEMDNISLGFYDAFPSEHTMFALVAGYYWHRYDRRMFWWMLPLLVLCVAATVVLRYHWVTDVMAGALLAPLVIWVSNKYGPWLAGVKDDRT